MNESINSFSISQLNRNPARVFAAASQQPVLISSRKGLAAWLMTKSEFDARAKLPKLVSKVLSAMHEQEGTRAQKLRSQLPWICLLDESEQDQCATEIFEATNESLTSGQALIAIRSVEYWQAVATDRQNNATS